MAKLEAKEELDLKYRPKVLKELVGQEGVVNILENSFKRGKISRRYLLTGPSGSGKTTTARMIAKYANCVSPEEDGSPCGKCISCEYEPENHPDVQEINFAEKTGIDDMRKVLRQADYAPQTNFRVFILDELHAASYNAKQAFLKPLEHPPPNTIWILATTNPEKLPDTVLGRCKPLVIKRVTIKACIKLLKRTAKAEKVKIPKNVLKRLAELVKGQPRSAMLALDPVLDYMYHNKKIKDKDLNKVLKRVISRVIDIPEEDRLAKYLTCIYRGQYTGALRVIEAIDPYNLDYFMRQAIEYHTQATYFQLSDKLQSDVFSDFYKCLQSVEYEVKHSVMGNIMTELVNCSVDIVDNRSVGSKALAVKYTLKCVNIVKGVKGE